MMGVGFFSRHAPRRATPFETFTVYLAEFCSHPLKGGRSHVHTRVLLHVKPQCFNAITYASIESNVKNVYIVIYIVIYSFEICLAQTDCRFDRLE